MVPLRLHTDFSLLKAMVPVSAIPEALKAHGYSAAAITDFDCGFGWVDYAFKMRAAELKPILGTHLLYPLSAEPSESSKKTTKKGGISFLVYNQEGYQNLSRILSAYSFESLSVEKLLKWKQGLALMIAPSHPEIACENSWLEQWDQEHLFFEVHRHEGAAAEAPAVKAAEYWGAGCVATQPIYYLRPENHLAHEIMMGIGAGTTLEDEKRPKLPSRDFYLRPASEMQARFQDQPEWIANTHKIADRVDFQFQTDKFHLPVIGKPDEVNQNFREECQKGLEQRLQLIQQKKPEINIEEIRSEYQKRLDHEVKVIEQMQFPGYFLIVADFIQWSKDNNIPVGPGRGSGAGSLAAYCLQITDIDPIEYNLLFERFLNPERVSMPDFDIDFCIKGRDRVIQYVRDKYNLDIDAPPEERLKVCQIITYGKMKSKAVIRDVGRVLGLPYSDVDAIAKLIPNVLNITLKEAFEMEPEFENLRQRDTKADQLLRIAEELEGMNRHTSVHAAGVVIADKVLSDYVPIFRNSEGDIVCQFEMKAVEKIGLIKFDFLGLRNLTVIKECIELTAKQIDLLKIDYNDSKVMEEISTGETQGIFQLESSGMREVIRRLRPSVFEDLIAIVALYRPGPLEGGMVDDFILRKRGQREVTFAVPALEPILKETYGVFVYQEQVMGTANIMAGFSLGGADLLRRAMGKKIAAEMAKQREKFVKGAVKNKYAEDQAQSIFDLMSEFAKYGFNKSHAAAYAMVTFQTAFLKTYYPQAFIAALLSSERDDIEKLGIIIRTALKRGIQVLPPHVNHSEENFSLEKTEEGLAIRYGLSAIKNFGANVARALVDARTQKGPFKNAQDVFNRLPANLINKRQGECLIRSGALDGMGFTRSSLFASLDKLTAEANAQSRARQAGQAALFQVKTKIKELEEWPDKIRLNDERHLLGTYMTGHPLESFAGVIRSYHADPIQKYLEGPVPPREKEVQIAGLVTSKKEIMTKKGKKMAFFSVEDLDAQIEIVAFPDLYAKQGDVIINDRLLLVKGQVVREESSTRLLAREVSDISQASFSKFNLCLRSKDQIEWLELFREHSGKFKGNIPVQVKIPVDDQIDGRSLKDSHVLIETDMMISTHPNLLSWVEGQFGEGSVQLVP